MSESTVEEVSEKETDENEEGIIELNDASLNSVNSIIQELQDKREKLNTWIESNLLARGLDPEEYTLSLEDGGFVKTELVKQRANAQSA